MFTNTPTGFKDAPLSKFLCLGTLVVPIASSLLNVQYLFNLRVAPHLVPWNQWYRVVLNSTIFTDQIGAFVAAELFYELRVVERFLGTGKFTRLVAGVWSATTIALPIILGLVSPVHNIEASSGSTALLAGLVTAYWNLVPACYYYKLEGVGTFSDKMLLLLLAPNLLFSESNLLKGVLGWVFGSLMLRYV